MGLTFKNHIGILILMILIATILFYFTEQHKKDPHYLPYLAGFFILNNFINFILRKIC